MFRRTLTLALLTVAFTTAAPRLGVACPNCKEAIAAQKPEDAARLKNGYFYSILLMVGMPVVLASTGAFFVVRAVRSGRLPEL